MRWTEKELDDFLAGRSFKATKTAMPSVDVADPPFKLPRNEAGRYALGRLPTGKMNKTEAAYDAHLWSLRHAGQILWHKFEGIKLRLADNTFYTCDFAVLPSDSVMEMHEIKGFMMEDANVKIKVAASIYPFRFKIVRAKAKKNGGGWSIEEIG
jgi:hypothetical protein